MLKPLISTLPTRGLVFLQLPATAAVLIWAPGNATKLAAMIFIWAFGFASLSGAELAMMGCVNLLFAAMDIGALGSGVFRFEYPDLFGLPAYEYLMWGFYTLHALRLLGGAPPRGRLVVPIVIAAAFATPFMTIHDSTILSLAAGAALVLGLTIFHEPLDLAYVGYLLLIGVIIEYIGTGTGQWSYPGSPWGGVPAWSALMWGGIGLFVRRLIQPLVSYVPSQDGSNR